MGQFRESDGFFTGRIGFEELRPTERWSPGKVDFEVTQMVNGQTSPFAIEVRTLRMAFQLRSGTIRTTTFTEAFRSLIKAQLGIDWTISPLAEGESWDEWRARVERITELHVTVREPNPTYNFDEPRELIEGANAKWLSFVAQAKPEDVRGLNVEGWLSGVLSHATDYGHTSAKGQTPDGTETEWSDKGAGKPKRVSVDEVDSVTTEVRTTHLERELREMDEMDDG